MERPTQEQLNTAREVIEWFQEKTIRDEPQAKNAIASYDETLTNLPVEMNEAE